MTKEEAKLRIDVTLDGVRCLHRCMIESIMRRNERTQKYRSFKGLYNVCIASRRGHSQEKFFQNMTFWLNDCGITQTSVAAFMHILYLSRLVNSKNITQDNINKINKGDSIKNRFLGSLNNAFGNNTLSVNVVNNIKSFAKVNEFMEIKNAIDKLEITKDEFRFDFDDFSDLMGDMIRDKEKIAI